MINRLTVQQASSLWDILKGAIEESLPPDASSRNGRMNSILTAILTGKMECWLSYEKDEEGKVIEGLLVILTAIIIDECSGGRYLSLYALAKLSEKVPEEAWAEGYVALMRYAKANQCDFILAHTNLEAVKVLAASLGADTSYTLLKFPIDPNIKEESHG